MILAMVGLGDALSQQPLLAAGLLFGAGVLTSLTPCVYPMIPITAGIIAGSAGPDATRMRLTGLTLVYVSGLAAFYALMGVIAGLTGTLFGTVASNPWVRVGIGGLLLVFGLAMLGVIPVRIPARLLAWAGRQGGGSLGGVFLLGAGSGVVAAPCGAPAFAAVLTWVATTQSAILGFVYLFVFSLGMTALLVVVGIFSGTLAALPKSGPWLVWVKRAGGVVLLGVAAYYFVIAASVLY